MIPVVYKKDGKYYELTVTKNEVNIPDVGYIIGKDGLYSVCQNNGYHIVSKAEKLPFDEVTEKTHCSFPKIPYKIYEQALGFLRAVLEKHKSEGNLLLVLNKNKPFTDGEDGVNDYRIVVPKQDVTGGSVEYSQGMKGAYAELEKGEFFAGTIHSHPTFSAFQSSTDHDDEIEFEGVHITLGHIDKKDSEVELHARICFAGQTINVEAEEYIETDKTAKVDVPKEWLKKVKSKKLWTQPDYWKRQPGYQSYSGYNYPSAMSTTADDLMKLVKPDDICLINDKTNEELTPFVIEEVL